jgi:hypothetical protein
MKYSPRRSGGWRERLFKTAVLRRSLEPLSLLRNASDCLLRGCPKQKEIRKQDQSGILAQIFLLCGKLRLEFSANDYSEPECVALSSAAEVTAAGAVQDWIESKVRARGLNKSRARG